MTRKECVHLKKYMIDLITNAMVVVAKRIQDVALTKSYPFVSNLHLFSLLNAKIMKLHLTNVQMTKNMCAHQNLFMIEVRIIAGTKKKRSFMTQDANLIKSHPFVLKGSLLSQLNAQRITKHRHLYAYLTSN